MKRLDAATAGMRIYDAEKPCKKDGTTQRYTTNGACVACCKKDSAGRYSHFKALLDAAKQV